MRKFELSGPGWRANLHCHSTISDGTYTPEELKQMYMKEGYSVIAFTDHDVLIDHSDLCSDGFLALNGYEMEVNDTKSGKTAHMCLIAKKQDNLTQVCYNKDRYVWGNALAYKNQIKFDCDDYIRVYSAEGVSDMMKRGRDAGFFVTYNHPTWSLESYPQYSSYNGMHAIEIFNTGCERVGFNEYNCHAYDDMLSLGRRIYCIAADDNHNPPMAYESGSPNSDSFGGWVVIFSPTLKYESITKALEDGRFYASTGPEIREFYVEDCWVHVKTSPAHRINYITATRHRNKVSANYGDSVTEAVFRIDKSDVYFRLDVIDDHGNHANTNAVFTDELFN